MHFLLRSAYFTVIYALVSGISFAVAYFAIGFPFFPENLVISRKQKLTLESSYSGWLHILFFKDGSRMNSHPSFSRTHVKVRSEDGTRELPLKRLEYQFQELHQGREIFGIAYGKFWAEKNTTIEIEINSAFSDFDGVIIRTGFERMLVSIGLFTLYSLVFSGLIFWFTQRAVVESMRNRL
jgi:hypothetical protein